MKDNIYTRSCAMPNKRPRSFLFFVSNQTPPSWKWSVQPLPCPVGADSSRVKIHLFVRPKQVWTLLTTQQVPADMADLYVLCIYHPGNQSPVGLVRHWWIFLHLRPHNIDIFLHHNSHVILYNWLSMLMISNKKQSISFSISPTALVVPVC